VRLAALPLIVLALAGCGNAAHSLSKPEYAKRMQQIENRDQAAPIRAYNQAVSPSVSAAACAADVRDLQRSLQLVVDHVRSLKPPPALASIHDDFVSNAQQSVDAVGAAAKRAASGDLHCGEEMNRTLYGMPSTDRAETALHRLADNGVPLCITTCE
jgi:hypothetical protein